ncbi:hypothetical protein ZTR_08112 [Talaromyces verruculosus]|nr:hypothetical protein ZTR_08112 [Talaromyces verruculosus]
MAPVKYLLVSAGLLASVMADYIAFSEWPASLVAGQPVTLKWVGGSDAPATITLRKGASTDLQEIQTLSSSATNGEFNWTPPADLQNADDYAFQITQGDEINYTGLLPLSGGSDAPNANALDKTKSGAESLSNSASAASVTGVSDLAATAAATGSTGTGTITSTGSSSSAEMNAESAAAAVTDTAASTGSTASDATGTTTGTTASEGSSATTSGPSSTETAKASKMNTPFVGSHMATPTATSSSSVQDGSAGRVGIPLALLAGAAGFLLLFV